MDKLQRHAFLIMAHGNWYTLEKLLLLLDAPWIDIYLHVDKKVMDFDENRFRCIMRHSDICMVKRHNVTWGNESQIKAEMELFSTAYKKGPYWYYHFLSGNDLPLRPINDIYKFFSNSQCNYLQITSAEQFEWRLKTYINIFRQRWLPKNLKKRLNAWSEIVQYKLKTNRLHWLKNHYPILGKGHNWCDLTEPAVEALMKSRRDIARFTLFTHCSDEMYKQIIILNHPELSKTICRADIRKIDWKEGDSHPKTYDLSDFDNLMANDQYIFARKFTDDVSRECIDKIYQSLSYGKE